jgi:hypothetical protein
MHNDNTFFAQPEGHVSGSIETAPSDPNFRYFGQRCDGDKSVAAALRGRKNMFATVEEFAVWRRSKGMPELDHWSLAWAWANFKGEPTTEQAIANPVLERR